MPLPIKKLVFPAHALAETDASTGLSMLAVGTSTARERQALPPRTTPARKIETNTLRDFWRLVCIAGELRQRVLDYARACRRSQPPQLLRRQLGALGQCLQLRPGNGGMHARLGAHPRREAAIRPGDHILLPHQLRVAADPLC